MPQLPVLPDSLALPGDTLPTAQQVSETVATLLVVALERATFWAILLFVWLHVLGLAMVWWFTRGPGGRPEVRDLDASPVATASQGLAKPVASAHDDVSLTAQQPGVPVELTQRDVRPWAEVELAMSRDLQTMAAQQGKPLSEAEARRMARELLVQSGVMG